MSKNPTNYNFFGLWDNELCAYFFFKNFDNHGFLGSSSNICPNPPLKKVSKGEAQIGVQLQTLTHLNPSAPCKMDVGIYVLKKPFFIILRSPYLTNTPLAHHAGWIVHGWETLFHCIPIRISNRHG